MTIEVDVWIRAKDLAKTVTIRSIPREPEEWIDDDVRTLLEGMLHEMDEINNPGQGGRVAALRGFSWIVNPFEGGFLLAIEMTLGAAVAGPFAIDKARFEAMITRVMAGSSSTPSTVIH